MLNAETVHNAGRSSIAYFTLAVAFFVIGGASNPIFLAVAVGFIAAGFAVRRNNQEIFCGAVLFALVALAFGYGIGKDLARRDNARSASASANGSNN